MNELITVKLRNGFKAWPWFDAGWINIIQRDGYRLSGSELRRSTMLEF